MILMPVPAFDDAPPLPSCAFWNMRYLSYSVETAWDAKLRNVNAVSSRHAVVGLSSMTSLLLVLFVSIIYEMHGNSLGRVWPLSSRKRMQLRILSTMKTFQTLWKGWLWLCVGRTAR